MVYQSVTWRNRTGFWFMFANHRRCDGMVRGIGDEAGEADGPVPENGDTVSRSAGFVELVSDEDHAPAIGGKPSAPRDELVDFAGCENRCRLIEEENPLAPDQGLQDLQSLLLPHRERLHQPAGGQALLQAPDQGLRQDRSPVPLSRSHTPGERQVLRNGQGRHRGEVLVDHSDPGASGISRGVQVGWSAVNSHRPCVGADEASGDVHQGGLPRTVFPEKGVDLTGPEKKLDSAQSLDGTEPPGHAAEVQDPFGRLAGHRNRVQRPVGWSWKVQGIPRCFDICSASAFTPTCSVA